MQRFTLIAIAALAAGLALPIAGADPAEAKPKWKDGGYGGGPPAWAPAHGYRRKQRYDRYGGGYRGGYGGGYRSGYGPAPGYYRY